MVLSDPGAAMNGNEFFIIKDGRLWHRKYTAPNYQWVQMLNVFGLGNRPPAAPLPPDRLFVMLANDAGLCEYNNTTNILTNCGTPIGAQIGTQVSSVMYGNHVYLIGGSGNLWEMKFGSAWRNGFTWYNFTHSFAGGTQLNDVTPCVFVDGKLFFSNTLGELIEMWWENSTSQWHYNNHSYPEVTGWWMFRKFTKVITIGAPMPLSAKLFVTCSDGTLRELYYNSSNSQWHWVNHGLPPSGYAHTPPVTVAEGKLFLNASINSNGDTIEKHLVELYWNGSQWVWNDHGHPPGGWLVGAICADPTSQRIYARCLDNNYWERSWSAGNWQWINHGAP